MVQPLFAEHCEVGGETCEEDGLDFDYCARRPDPLWRSGNVVSGGGIVDFVNKKAKEDGDLITGIGLEFGIKLDDKCGGNCRE